MKILDAFKASLFAGIIFGLIACTVTPTSSITKKDAEIVAKQKELSELKASFEQTIKKKESEITSVKDEVIKSKDAQIKEASNGLFAADATFKTIPKPVRTDLITNNYVNESWTALGRVMPDYETMVKINTRLKNELDETKTSLADLQKTHDAIMSQNQKLSDNTKNLSDKIAALQQDIGNIKADYSAKLLAKHEELVKLANEKIVLEKQRADDAAAIQRAKMKFSLILGAIALAALAGAIYSPVFKDKCAIFAGVCGAAAVGIWYITPFIVGVFFAVVFVVLVAWAFYKFHIADKTNNAYINFEHELQTNNPALYAQVEADLNAWKTRYIRDKSGNVTTVPDKSITTLVDDKLIATDKK